MQEEFNPFDLLHKKLSRKILTLKCDTFVAEVDMHVKI